MNTIAQWLTEEGNIVVPKTLDTQVFDENGTRVIEDYEELKEWWNNEE